MEVYNMLLIADEFNSVYYSNFIVVPKVKSQINVNHFNKNINGISFVINKIADVLFVGGHIFTLEHDIDDVVNI